MATRLSVPAALSWQPQTLPVITKSPLGFGLMEAFVNFGGQMVPIQQQPYGAQPQIPLNRNANPTQTINRFGNAATYNGTTQFHSRGSAPYPFNTSLPSLKEVSMMILAKRNGAGGTTIAYGYGNSTTNNPLCIMGNSPSGPLSIRVRDTAGTDVELIDGGSNDWTNGVNGVFICTRSESSNKGVTYCNGVVTRDSTAGAAVGSVSFDRTTLGALTRATTSLYLACDLNLAAIWTRCLTRSEAFALSMNPWQIFDFPTRPLLLDAATAAAFLARQGLHIRQAQNRAATF